MALYASTYKVAIPWSNREIVSPNNGSLRQSLVFGDPSKGAEVALPSGGRFPAAGGNRHEI